MRIVRRRHPWRRTKKKSECGIPKRSDPTKISTNESSRDVLSAACCCPVHSPTRCSLTRWLIFLECELLLLLVLVGAFYSSRLTSLARNGPSIRRNWELLIVYLVSCCSISLHYLFVGSLKNQQLKNPINCEWKEYWSLLVPGTSD